MCEEAADRIEALEADRATYNGWTEEIKIEVACLIERIEALETALRVSHQNCLALWEALEGGASPRCRDCADFNGRCQGNGPACEPQERALERIKALRAALAPSEPLGNPDDPGWAKARAALAPETKE
jgi:hypothetical protein